MSIHNDGMGADTPMAVWPPIEIDVAGIFKGGGARGVVYVGALRELRARGIWFSSVAGSSAGAITAALIAMAVSPDLLAEHAADALTTIRKNSWRGFIPWKEHSWFRTDRLREWLEDRLRESLGIESSEAVEPTTFIQLFNKTLIELNVVAMDLHRKQPIVFNHLTTPNYSVSAAVVASCAIPVAMPAGRATVEFQDGGDSPRSIHRLVDGGAWANYPAFVYRDPSFREYYGLPALSPDTITLGFVIDANETQDLASPGTPIPPPPFDPAAIATPRPQISPYDRGSARFVGRVGALLSWTGFRWLTLAGLPLLISFILVRWLDAQAGADFSFFASMPRAAQLPLSIVTLFVITGSAIVALLIAFAHARFADEAVEVGFPSLQAALSVGVGVPDWVGSSTTDRVVRLWSPRGITTTSFRASRLLQQSAIGVSEVTTAIQLDSLFPAQLRASFTDVPRTDNPVAAAGAIVAKDEYAPPRLWAPWVAFWLVVLTFVGVGVVSGPEMGDSFWRNVLEVGGFVVVVLMLIAFWCLLMISLVRALVYRRQLNEGLLPNATASTNRWVARVVIGALAAWLGVYALHVIATDGGLARDYAESISNYERLGQAIVPALVALSGVGSILSGIARLTAKRRHMRYLEEIA